jgi:hypothetical protein
MGIIGGCLFASTTAAWRETLEYSAQKNAMADPFLPPVWVQYRHSNIATGFSNAYRTGRAGNNTSFDQCLDFQLFSRHQAL